MARCKARKRKKAAPSGLLLGMNPLEGTDGYR